MVMKIPISVEAYPPHSAYVCCPKCGEEVFVFQEKIVYMNGDHRSDRVYMCSSCRNRWTFALSDDYDECIKVIRRSFICNG